MGQLGFSCLVSQTLKTGPFISNASHEPEDTPQWATPDACVTPELEVIRTGGLVQARGGEGRQGGRGRQGPGPASALGHWRQHLLRHHTDLHTKDASLLFGRGPLQAHISAGEFHGEFYFDLVGMKQASIPQGLRACGVPPKRRGCSAGLQTRAPSRARAP